MSTIFNCFRLIFYTTVIFFVAVFGALAMEVQRLDGDWAFKTDPMNRGLSQQWFDSDYQRTFQHWDTLAVPGNWDVEQDYADYTGVAWYATTFTLNDLSDAQRVRLVFESVYNDSTVWLNGKKIGDNPFGYLPFHFDIERELDSDGPNTLVVRVDNTFKRGAIWNWGGIRRPVWLEITAPTRIETQHITAVPDLENGTASVDVAINLSTSNSPNTVEYEWHVARRNAPNDILLSHRGVANPKGDGVLNANFSVTLSPEQVDLWDYNHPHLYIATLRLVDTNEAKISRFGIRKLELDGFELKLNGNVFRPLGFNVVSEDRFTGNTLPIERIKEDIALMKSLGANFARVSHMPLPKAYLDLLDENGIMTFEEVALWGKDAWADPDHPMPKRWLDIMVSHKFNHPSIVGWSVGNEIGSTRANPRVNEYIKGAIAQTKQLDPSRFAVYVSNTAQNSKNDAAIYSDIIMLNIYGGWGKALERTHRNFPNKPIFMSEYGRVLNNELPNLGVLDAQSMVDALRNKPYTIGGSLWTLNDYRSKWYGNEGWATGPSQNRAWGIVNAYRQKKRAYYAFETEYAPIKHIELTYDTDSQRANVVFDARSPLDLPAYQLEDYGLRWIAFDNSGKQIAQYEQALPTILPDAKTYRFNWPIEGQPARVSLSLIDNLGHTLISRTLDRLAPEAAQHVSVIHAAKQNRVVFDSAWNAQEHFLRYQEKGEWKETPPTIGNYIDVKTPKNGEQEVVLVARNAQGETQSTPLVITHSEQDLPPVVLQVTGGGDAIYVGYETTHYDFLYDIRYGQQSGQLNNQFSFNSKGSVKISDLSPGTYFIQMRKRAQHGFASQWSEEFRVVVGEENAFTY